MEGHSAQKCNVIATSILLDRIRVPLDRAFLPGILSYFNHFVASYITLVYSSGISHLSVSSVETAFHRIVTTVRPKSQFGQR